MRGADFSGFDHLHSTTQCCGCSSWFLRAGAALFLPVRQVILRALFGTVPLTSEGPSLCTRAKHSERRCRCAVSRRYERGAILLTSNRSVGEWGTVFGDPVVATAILDRLLHHSHVITIRGDSYRLKEKRRSGLLQKSEKKA